MKKTLFMSLALLSAAHANAQYVGPTIAPTTVAALTKDGKDDQKVVLQGRIVRHSGGDKYRFADSTGEMDIEVDAKYWPAGVRVDDKVTVRLHGEYDKELIGNAEVDVKQVEIVK